MNIRDLPPQTPIYRYVRLGHLLSDIENKTFTLQSVKKWDDWTERMLDFLYPASGDESCVQTSYGMDHIYGSCWSRKNNWSIRWDAESPNYNIKEDIPQHYTYRKSSVDHKIEYLLSDDEEKMLNRSKVCIESTIGKLHDTLKGKEHRSGIVQYSTKSDFFKLCIWAKEQIMNTNRKHSLEDLYGSVLFNKRDTFCYEKEYRIVVFDGDLSHEVLANEFSDILRIPWNPIVCIDKIKLHPFYQLNMSFKSAPVIWDRMTEQEKHSRYAYIRYFIHVFSNLYSAFSKAGLKGEVRGFLRQARS